MIAQPDNLPAKYGGRGPLCFLLFAAMSVGGVGTWIWTNTHSTGGGIDNLIAAAALQPQLEPRAYKRDTSTAAVAWSPRFRNNTLICLETARERQVLTWYAGKGGKICPDKVDTTMCEAEARACAVALDANGAVIGRQVDFGAVCCASLSVVCRAFYAYAFRCQELQRI